MVEYIVLQPKAALTSHYLYFIARSEAFRAFAISNMSGTSGRQRVPTDCLNYYNVIVPDDNTIRAFEQIVSPMFAKIKNNDEQSRTLASLRDLLLPKLISGEIRLPTTNDPDKLLDFAHDVASTQASV